MDEYGKGNYRTQDNECTLGAKHRLDFGLPETRMRLMALCTFRGRAPVNFALTVLNGDPGYPASWRREVWPVCPRCHRALAPWPAPSGGSSRTQASAGF